MKQTLCLLTLILCCCLCPVHAVETQTLFPAEVHVSESNGISHIEKVYHLSIMDDPSLIPTEDFIREGKTYTLLDILKTPQTDTDTQDYVEVVSLDSDSKDMEAILSLLSPEMEVETEDGYYGVLSLDHTSITVEVAGYSSSTRTVSATRTYPNLSGADTSLIPKTIQENGRTLTLADVQWQDAATSHTDGYDLAIRYTANATYTGTATSQYATGYVVTANYTGEVTHTSHDKVVYTAVFSSMDTTPTSEAEPTTENSVSIHPNWLLLPAGVVGLGVAGYFGVKQYRHYINKKRGYE